VGESQGVTELVSGHLEQIGASRRANGPQFRVVKVGISAKDREEGMRQGAALTVKGIAVSMLALHEPGSKGKEGEEDWQLYLIKAFVVLT